MLKHINIKITGRVHGIGFRWTAYEKFVELGLLGRAENTTDGVLIDVEGEDSALAPLIDWAHQGPSGAAVEKVEVVEAAGPFVPLKNG